jgi:nicotinamidase-related amidase
MTTALVILDMLSEFRFPNGAALNRAASKVAPAIAKIARRARNAGVPVVYVNDTAGRWESDQREFLARCLRGPGGATAELLAPLASDYFMFKPKHSAFYGTPLAELFYSLKVNRIVLTGQSSHQCVLLTASDAHVRNLDVVVASDCIASVKAADTRHAAYVLQHGLGAQYVPSRSVRLRERRPAAK